MSLLAGLQAGVMGLPFMPVRGILGTDYIKVRPDFNVIENPYGEDRVVLVPPLRPAVSLLHSLAADTEGNVLVDAFDNDSLLARASHRVFASTEKILPQNKLKALPGVLIPATYIQGVIPLAGGGKPTRCRGSYPFEEKEILAYLEAARQEEAFQEYLQNYLREGEG